MHDEKIKNYFDGLIKSDELTSNINELDQTLKELKDEKSSMLKEETDAVKLATQNLIIGSVAIPLAEKMAILAPTYDNKYFDGEIEPILRDALSNSPQKHLLEKAIAVQRDQAKKFENWGIPKATLVAFIGFLKEEKLMASKGDKKGKSRKEITMSDFTI